MGASPRSAARSARCWHGRRAMSDAIKAALDAAALTIADGCQTLCGIKEGRDCDCRDSVARTIAAFLRALPEWSVGDGMPSQESGVRLAAAVEKAARDD